MCKYFQKKLIACIFCYFLYLNSFHKCKACCILSFIHNAIVGQVLKDLCSHIKGNEKNIQRRNYKYLAYGNRNYILLMLQKLHYFLHLSLAFKNTCISISSDLSQIFVMDTCSLDMLQLLCTVSRQVCVKDKEETISVSSLCAQ